MEKIIEIKQLVKDYGSFRAVDHLSLDVYHGDVFGFLGPNGAGKSTTIRMLLTLIKPTEGNISLFGKALLQHRNEILRNIGCIVEKPDFYNYLSAEQNLQLFAKLSGVQATKKRMQELFELVGLKGRGGDKVKAYSHGMKQRLGLAQTLIHNPLLIILDEPTTGLDPQGIIDIRNLINHLSKDKGITIFLSSHILSEIELIATRMAIINKGKTIVQGSVKELLNTEEMVVMFSVDDVQRSTAIAKQENFELVSTEVNANQFSVHLSKEQIPILNKKLIENNIAVYSMESKRKLEDYFLRLVN